MKNANLRGFPADEQACAWLRAFLRGTRSGDVRLVALAEAELRLLGLAVAVIPTTGAP
jgi:hypothetical protein